jgi:hypothetical protein
MSADLTRDAVSNRLRRVAELSVALGPRPRVDLSAQSISDRLRSASELSALCFRLVEIGQGNGLGARKATR